YAGSWTADLFYQFLGFSAWLFPILLVAALIRWFLSNPKSKHILDLRWWAGFIVAALSIGLLLELSKLGIHEAEGFPSAGLLGIGVTTVSLPLLGKAGTYLLSVALAWSFC